MQLLYCVPGPTALAKGRGASRTTRSLLRPSPISSRKQRFSNYLDQSTSMICKAAATDVDVCVVGGGPAGLAAACAILRAVPGTTVKVLESTQRYLPQGAGILVTSNGWKALDAIDPAIKARLEPNLVPLTMTILWKGEDGEVINLNPMSLQPIDPNNPPPPVLAMSQIASWSDLRDSLYDMLPEGVVQFGCKGLGFNLEGEGSQQTVRVQFKPDDPAAEQAEITARMLIGADGFYSKIRAQWVGDGPPAFTRTFQWRAKLHVPERGPDPAGVRSYTRGRLFCNKGFFGKRSLFVYPAGKDQWAWLLMISTEHLEAAGFSFDPTKPRGSVKHEDPAFNTAKAACLELISNFPEEALQVIRATPEEIITQHPEYLRDFDTWPEDKFGDGPLTLVGDAAHLGRVDGQGMNQSFEDAAVLGWYLQQHGLTQEALRAFEKERLPRVKLVLRHNEVHPERRRLVQEFNPRPLQPVTTEAAA